MNLRFRIAARESVAYVTEAIRIRRDEARFDQIVGILHRAVGLAGFEAPHPFAERLFERAANRHDLADAFHLRSKHGLRTREFFELPARDFRHHVIDGRLEAGGRLARDVVLDFVQTITDSEFRGDFGDGESRGFRRQRRAARNARIHFDDHHAPGFRIDGKLHVRAAGIHADFAQAGQRAVAHHLIFAIRQRLRRSYGDGIAGVHAHGIEIFNRANDDAVVGLVAHHLKLEFLPAEHAFFDKHFMHGRKIESALQNFFGFLAIVGNAAARSAHRKAGTENHRIADARGEFQALVHRSDQLRLRQIEPDLLHRVFKQQAIFGLFDGIDLRANELDTIFFENAGLRQRHRKIQACLAADRGKQRIGTLAANHLFGVLHAQRFNIRAIRQIRIRHDGGRIRIDEDDFVAFGT